MNEEEIREFEKFIKNEEIVEKEVLEMALNFVEKRRKNIEFDSDNVIYFFPNLINNVANHGTYLLEPKKYEKEGSA